MYKSPIEVLVADIQHQIAKQQDEETYKAVVSVGINVDKEELIRALAYDRHQYMKGHIDGVAEATASHRDGKVQLKLYKATDDKKIKKAIEAEGYEVKSICTKQ